MTWIYLTSISILVAYNACPDLPYHLVFFEWFSKIDYLKNLIKQGENIERECVLYQSLFNVTFSFTTVLFALLSSLSHYRFNL